MELVKYHKLSENKELKKQAMLMYVSGEFYPTEIAAKLSIDIDELARYVFGKNGLGTDKSCWEYKKVHGNVAKWTETYEAVKPLFIKKTEKKLLDAVNKIIDRISSDDTVMEELDTKDLASLIASYEKLDKIGRLEEGKATSHVVSERTTFSLRDIVENVDYTVND